MIIKYYFKNVLLVYKLLFYYIFSISKSKVNKILVNHTFGKTYRFSSKDTNDLLIVLKYYFRIILYKVSTIEKQNGKTIILDVLPNSRKIREDYVSYFYKEKTDGFLALSSLRMFNSLSLKWGYIFMTTPLAFVLFVVSLFYSDKTKYALLLESVLILSNLTYSLSSVEKVLYFSIYEIESNLFAYVLMNNGVNIVKVPSEVPLSFWNRNILSSSLVICNAYQEEEIKEYYSTIQVGELLFWGPERYQEISSLYLSKDEEPPENVIGFYSSASWVRRENGDFEPSNLFENELKICKALNKLLSLHDDIELIVFLHPREKKDGWVSKSYEYYQSVFEGKNFKIADTSLASSASFKTVNIALSVGSTLMYERLYSGFKAVFYQDEEDIPINNSSLSNIWIKDEGQFIQKMEESLRLSQVEFFKENKLSHYCPKFKNN